MGNEILLCSFLVFFVSAQDIPANVSVINNITSVTELPQNITEITPNATVIVEEDDYQYIVKLEYRFKEERVPEFISEIIANGTEETQITISDLVSLTKLQMFSLNYTLDFIRSIGIPPSYVFNINFFENTLKVLHVPFGNFYIALNNSLSLPPSVLVQVLKDLEIDKDKFAVAISFGEYNIYDILRNGSFSAANLEKVANSTHIPLDEIFLAMKDVILENLRRFDKTEFDSLLKENGIDKNIIMMLWNLFGITLEDVYSVNSLRKLLNDIVFNLNRETSIGVVSEKNTLFLHTNDYENCQTIRKNIRIYTRSFLNDNVTSEIGTFIQKVNRNTVELQLNNVSPKSIKIGKSNSSKMLGNCTYVTFIRDELIYQNIDVVRNFVDYLEIDNNNQTFFNPGSPLICDKKLYGMAAVRQLRTIDFDSLYNYHAIGGTTANMGTKENTGTTRPSPTNSGVDSKANLFFPSIAVYLILLICIYF